MIDNFLSVETLILLGATYLVTAGIKSLSGLAGKDLSGNAAAVTASLVALAMAIFNSLIVPQVPPEYLPLIEQVAGLIVGLLGAMGLHRTVKGVSG